MKNGNIFYDYMAEKMKEHADLSQTEISYKKARYILSRFNVPQWLWMPLVANPLERQMLITVR